MSGMSQGQRSRSICIEPAARVHGALSVPGDKSISHRALILAALAPGRSSIRGLAGGADVRATRRCLEALGVEFTTFEELLLVEGPGLEGLQAPEQPLDCGNSGTTLRLLAGALAGSAVEATLTGDASLRRRPMARVTEPLRRMGARIEGSPGGADGEVAPLHVRGAGASGQPLRAIEHTSPVPSAQVKSAVLLAGLAAEGRTAVREPVPSRDHTERMLRLFGVDVLEEGGAVGFSGPCELVPARIDVPGDLSSAAFALCAAAGLPGSRLVVREVGINPTRSGVLDVLARMGVRLHRGNEDEMGFEPVADLFAVAPERLAPLHIEEAEVPRLLDEIPVLAVLATRAAGVSEIRGAGELRHKESDRLAAIAALLGALGGHAEVAGERLRIEGPQRLRGGTVHSGGDHRIAMAAAVAALFAEEPVTIEDAGCVEVSYPGFFEALQQLVVR
ncbi:MAG: 3-phosphoshikimate 1-carboxyvinyltransferase [Planctomycetota bacterium]|nr:MAG: 3-phosphoshikimate 1-carboxyvinyltransferase [Planctomycetota bacterium]